MGYLIGAIVVFSVLVAIGSVKVSGDISEAERKLEWDKIVMGVKENDYDK